MSGQALALRSELAQLARRHRVEPKPSCALPLAEPSSRPVIITGIASSCTVDQERMRFRPWSLSFIPWRPPALLYRHREPAGEITRIFNDAKGRVIIEARVDHPAAAQCQGLSVGATIEKYELRDIDDPENYHALILQASLDEISLTPTPANAACVVTSRTPTVSPAFYDTAISAMAKAQEIVALLQQMNRKPAPVVRVRTAPGKIYGKIPERPRPAPRATQFSELVQQLSARGT